MKIEKLGDITRPIVAMADDVLRAEAAMNAASDGYSRRNYIRSLFAMIEGTVYILKQMTLLAETTRPELLTTAEMALLKEQAFDLNSKGEARTTTKFLRLADNLRFTMHTFGRVFGGDVALPVGHAGWDDLLHAIAVRNRITHPKSLTEFEVTKDEAETTTRVSYWFNAFISHALETAIPSLAKPKRVETGASDA